MESHAQDVYWMQHALQLAKEGRYTARPNPCVGAVLVKEGNIIGRGWHSCTGEAHAEVYALQEAGDAARGATCYVTLEPCAHYGHTPPCCDALMAAGVTRVVAATGDPNPKTNGLGIARLQQHGIAVTTGILEIEARQLNRAFLKRIIHNKPWVTVKLGMTLDGRIADHKGHSQWITNEIARQEVQQLRAEHAAILTTATTVIEDQARLTVRSFPKDMHDTVVKKFKQPLRIILDNRAKLTFKERIFSEEGNILVYSSEQNTVSELSSVECVMMSLNNTHFNIEPILQDLAKREINSVLIEAGANFSGQLLKTNLVDEFIFYLAPKVLGQQAKSVFELEQAILLEEVYQLRFKEVCFCGDNIKIVVERVQE